MADFRVFATLAIARSCEHFWSRGLRKNVVQWLHFKCLLIERRWDLRRGVLGACECGLLFWRFSLCPPFEESEKISDFGVFAKLAIARSCEHFWRRALRQNAVRWLLFKRQCVFNSDLSVLSRWFRLNYLKIITSKTQAVAIRPSLYEYEFHLNNMNVETQDTLKILGVKVKKFYKLGAES